VIAELVTVDELMEALGRSERTVTGYIRRGMPTDSVEVASQWVADNINNNGPPTIGERKAGLTSRRIPKNELDEEEQRARIRKLDAEGAAKELANAVKRGELMNTDDANLSVSELCLMVKARLEAIPEKVTTDCPAEMRPALLQRWSDEIHLILTEMSQWRLSQ
jgi:phage terminase Nu1 subunit (DNA packaging protein)